MVEIAELLQRGRVRRSLPDPALRRLIRQRAGITPAELAEAIGVSRPAVVRWELGNRTPTGENLTRYAEVLSRLIAEIGVPTPEMRSPALSGRMGEREEKNREPTYHTPAAA
jgi:transcriptional regulator with XRE-family HTH domain